MRAEPRAARLIESMRDIGYSLETALADIIDNSITAGAKRVDILADTKTLSPSIAIVDDGCGMDEAQLLEAMRPGSRSPLADRHAADLGRFGLGLKTASFSQCRSLTVVTRTGAGTHALRWDLDRVATTNKWEVEVVEDCDELPGVDALGQSGTAVIWERLDRVVEAAGSDAHHLIQKLDDATKHLELVFHRFLEGETNLPRVVITLNYRALVAFDPFFKKHRSTVKSPGEVIQFKGHRIGLQAYTLPHHNKVSTKDWEHYGGPAGYVKNQGFYLYRARRLIVYGTWFGLARQREVTKLARVQIDTPNELDADWKVDVKKASAQPPAAVRERLRRLIDTLGATSRRVYSTRGVRLLSENKLPVWVRLLDKGSISYRLNEEHPVFAQFEAKLLDSERQEFRRALEVAAASLPLDALFSDLGDEDGAVNLEWISDDALRDSLSTAVACLSGNNIARSQIVEMLKLAEPFRSNWNRAAPMLGELRPA